MSSSVTSSNVSTPLNKPVITVSNPGKLTTSYASVPSSTISTSALKSSFSINQKRGSLSGYLKNGNKLMDGEFFFDDTTETLYIPKDGILYAFPAYKTSFETFKEDAVKHKMGEFADYF